MLIAQATFTRALVGAVFAAGVLALSPACSDQGTERKGGGDMPDLTAGSTMSAGSSGMTASGEGGAAGAAEAGSAGAVNSAPVPWCAAYKIINCVCQQCHQNPPLNGAPLPLMTYEDTQAGYPHPASTKRVWQEMQTVVTSRFMPLTSDVSVMPPVKPLSDEHQNTLLTWLSEGANREGGTDCPMACDWSKGPPSGNF